MLIERGYALLFNVWRRMDTARWDAGFLHGLLEAYELTFVERHAGYTTLGQHVRNVLLDRMVEVDVGLGTWLVAAVFNFYGPLTPERLDAARRESFLDWEPYRALRRDQQRTYAEEREAHGE